MTDERLAAAVLPAYEGAKPVAREVERVFAPSEGDSVFAGGYAGMRDPACRRWANSLRDAAAHVKAKDDDARIASAQFKIPGPAVRLLVARPAMIQELERDALADCRATEAELNGHRSAIKAVPLTTTAKLGEHTQAYRLNPGDNPAAIVKEVRFGPYLLQVNMAAADEKQLSVQRLEDATQQAYEHARKALRDIPSAPSGTPSPSATSRFAQEPPRADNDLMFDPRLVGAVLTRFRDAQPNRIPGVIRPLPRANRVSPDFTPLDTRTHAAVEYADLANHPCSAWASGIWSAAPPGDGIAPQYGVSALTRDDGFYLAEHLVWATPKMIDTITTPGPPGRCRSVTTEINGDKVTLKAIPIKTAKVGDDSWAYKIETKPGDAPILVKWVRFGPYLAEIRIGTTGTKSNNDVTTQTLDEAAQAAYTRALQSLT